MNRIIAAIIAALTLLTTGSPAYAAVAPTTASGFNLDPDRWVIAHRGQPRLYPEEGPRGYDRSTDAGLTLEADARQLKDGTWVLLHDSTVDRTMTGVKGPVNALTLARWTNARLKPSPTATGYTKFQTDRPITLNQFLGWYERKVPLLIEHKGGDVTSFIATIKARSTVYRKSIMLQSFDFATAARFKAEGLTPMYLVGKTVPVPLETIKAAGIRYIGIAAGMDPALITQLKAAGFELVSYTVNSRAAFDAQDKYGVDGVFSDNPAALK